ncbi:MAG: FtsX-like permease family protein [Pseudohongiellaceae bacterium]
MFYNYFLIALQQLRKQPVFSAIKVLSLTLGLVCSILVITHVQYTYSYDKHFPGWENVYRMVTSFTTDQRVNSNQIADAYLPPLLQDYQQIETAARVQSTNGLFARGDEAASNDYLWVEPQFLDIFPRDFLQGDAATALTDINTVIMDETTAQKYFGSEDPMGQILTLDNQFDLRVTGIVRDLPQNTHMDMPMLVSAETARAVFGANFMNGTTWAGYGGTMAYMVIPIAAEAQNISADLADFIQRNVPEQQRDFVNRIDVTLSLESLEDIYLSPRQGFGAQNNPRAQILLGLSAFAILILITSCINFANLSLSQVQQRGKEIGVRKTLGANRGQVVIQFLFESLLLTAIALLIALPAVYLLLPVYTALTNTEFTLATLLEANQAGVLIVFVLLTGVLSGLVPALILSRFQPVTSIKGLGLRGRLSRLVRSAITVVQFATAMILVLLAIAINLQIGFLNDFEMGFNRNNLVILDTRFNPRNAEEFNYDALINDLRQHPGVVNVARSQTPPPNTGGYNPWRREGWPAEQLVPISHFGVDENYVRTMELQLLAGRDFSLDFPADYMPAGQPNTEQVYGALITPAAVSNFEFESNDDALNKILELGNLKFRVVGVVDNFRLGGGLEDVLRSTSVLRANAAPVRPLLIRIDPAQQESVLAHIDTVWERHRPEIPINRTFYSATYNQAVYDQTNGISKASLFAAFITICIAALGLYALAFYSSQRRTKEVGVRKVLGATSGSIIGLLTWDFIKPVLVASLLAGLGGYYAASYFFKQFQSSTELPAVFYGLVMAVTLIVAVLTVAVQCYRTASADPVTSLRYE